MTKKSGNGPARQISGIYNDENTPNEILQNNTSDLDITANEQFFINQKAKSYKFNSLGSFAQGPYENDNARAQKEYENEKQNEKMKNYENRASNINSIQDQDIQNFIHEENKNAQRQRTLDTISDYDSPDFLHRKIDKKFINQDQTSFQNSHEYNLIQLQDEYQINNKYKKDQKNDQQFQPNLIQNEKNLNNKQQRNTLQSNQSVEELDSPVRQKKPPQQLIDLKEQEKLLVIGFDEQPKGRNPLLQNKRSPAYDKNNGFPTSLNFPQSTQNKKTQQIGFQKQKQLNIIKKVDSVIQQEQQKNNSTAYSNTLNQTVEQINGKIQYSLQKDSFNKQNHTNAQEELKQKIIQEETKNQDNHRKYQNAELIISDEMPNLQDFAKQKLTKEQFKNRQGKGGNQMQGTPSANVSKDIHIIQNSLTQNNNYNKQIQRQNQDFNLPINYRFNEAQMLEQSQQQPKRGEIKTKEELAQIRNQMMKSKFKDRKQQSQQELQKQEEILKIGINQFNINERQLMNQHTSYGDIGKQIETEPGIGQNQEILLARLATGSKVIVDKKEMKKLTVKNYEKLPEVMKKKQEKKKQEEQAQRKVKYAVYQKELAQRIRNNNKKFQKKDNNEEE